MLIFPNNLELNFASSSSIPFNAALAQVQISQKAEMQIKVTMDKQETNPEILMLVPLELVINRVEVKKEEGDTTNACRCHWGGRNSSV
ncbi:hypothetical protein HDV03_004713 [Kappamyces sp. JEL0829]|nr:hypothetical protein HDV03_004713 [Kappamyces sp. JEL0829]KAJ3360531.1 hypothetical protein HDU91_004529 [Kappamyces sp. JEL0680]